MNTLRLTLCSLLAGTVLVLASSATSSLHAQGTPADGGPIPDPEPTAVPIDGGASLLLAGGVVYGLNTLRKRRARS